MHQLHYQHNQCNPIIINTNEAETRCCKNQSPARNIWLRVQSAAPQPLQVFAFLTVGAQNAAGPRGPWQDAAPPLPLLRGRGFLPAAVVLLCSLRAHGAGSAALIPWTQPNAQATPSSCQEAPAARLAAGPAACLATNHGGMATTTASAARGSAISWGWCPGLVRR